MKKVVIKFSALEDAKIKGKSFKAVAGMLGVESASIDMKELKITVIGEADPVQIALKLKKYGSPQLVSVGPAKEEKEEKKEEKKQENKEKEGPQNPTTPRVVYQELCPVYPAYPPAIQDHCDPCCTIC